MDSSYVEPHAQPDYLVPYIVAAILDETLPPDLTLLDLAVDPPGLWDEQQGRMEMLNSS